MNLVAKKQQGFTLTEILIAIAIVAIMSTVVALNFLGETDKARLTRVKGDLTTLESALQGFYNDNGFFPTTDQGLEALVSKPTNEPVPRNYRKGGYLGSGGLIKDPWQSPYQYISPGQNGEFDLFSMGADGRPGGEGKFQDIGTWNMNQVSFNEEN
ncbi:type II secretion system major pseudopilin GspG [Kangiella sp. TOML190]|uniref:type II secretion system major pseudopilin GspG n=1 Tax=Kangiella sp. TOML190 TaxID=2931351 RepID=UPI0035D8B9C1